MKKAFTLIELLVVIAIIAILAAILFPVFAQAKTAAKKTASLSNIKQLNLGVQMYNTDADDTMPMALSTTGYPVESAPASDFVLTPQEEAEVSAYWASAVQPYSKSWDLYKDSSLKDLNPFGYPARAKRFGYSLNSYLHYMSATAVTAPANAISFWMGTGPQNLVGYAQSFPQPNLKTGYPTNANWRFERSGANCTTYGGLNLGGGQTTTSWDYRVYNNSSNIAYVDGHASSVNVYSNRYPWILNKTTGKPTSLWVDSTDGAAGCTYFSVLSPYREE